MSGGSTIEAPDLDLVDGGETESLLSELEAPAPEPAHEAPRGGTELPKDLVAHLDAIERDILQRALERHRYNRTAAGASLGLSLRQMRYRMARLGIGTGEVAVDRGDAT